MSESTKLTLDSCLYFSCIPCRYEKSGVCSFHYSIVQCETESPPTRPGYDAKPLGTMPGHVGGKSLSPPTRPGCEAILITKGKRTTMN